MFKAQYTRTRIRFTLAPEGPILVRSGQPTLDPSRPDMELVRTRHPVAGETVYLPGSSLKGVVRAQAERILRTMDLPVCDCFDHKNEKGQCQRTGSDAKVRGPEAHTRLCAACRTFGSTLVAGRTAFCDAFPWPEGASDEAIKKAAAGANRTEVRTGVGIDRRTGATRKGVLYDIEVITQGVFHAEIVLRNAQLWQVGLVGHVLSDLQEGFARVGGGKSRGLGRVRVRLLEVRHEQIRRAEQGSELLGVGALCSGEDLRAYGLSAGDRAALPDGLSFDEEADPFFRVVVAPGPDNGALRLLRACQGGPFQAALTSLGRSASHG